MISQLIINGVIAGSIYALIALSFNIIYATVKFFHFAHGAIYTIGAYFAFAILSIPGMPRFPGLILASILSGILGTLIYNYIYYYLQQKNAPNLVFLLTSFGIFVFIQNGLQILFGTGIKSLQIFAENNGYKVLGGIITKPQLIIIFTSLSLAVFLIYFIKLTKLGKAFRAVAEDPIAACIIGINPEQITRISFFLGSSLAGAAGILVSLETSIEPTMGMNAILKGIIAAVVGGVGNISGALLGGLLIGLAENLGVWGISSGWKDTIAFAVLVVFLLLQPNGIFSYRKRNW